MEKTIAYLDDEAQLCELFKMFVEQFGYKVVTFTNPRGLIDYCQDNAIDLLFLDFRLKETTGDKIAKSVDKVTTNNIPKILVSGDIHVETDYQFQGMMQKPFKLMEIKQFIENFFAE